MFHDDDEYPLQPELQCSARHLLAMAPNEGLPQHQNPEFQREDKSHAHLDSLLRAEYCMVRAKRSAQNTASSLPR